MISFRAPHDVTLLHYAERWPAASEVLVRTLYSGISAGTTVDNTIARFAGLFLKPSDGLEPLTPPYHGGFALRRRGLAIALRMALALQIALFTSAWKVFPRRPEWTRATRNLSPGPVPRRLPRAVVAVCGNWFETCSAAIASTVALISLVDMLGSKIFTLGPRPRTPAVGIAGCCEAAAAPLR